MYTLLELNNFRHFKNYSMELKPITLISGRNNTGKSSILDALFLFQDYADPEVFSKLFGFRGMRKFEFSPRNLWEPLFYNMDLKDAMIVRVNGESALILEKNKGFSLSNGTHNILDGKFDSHSSNYALSCVFEKAGKRYAGDYLIGNEKQNYDIALINHADATLLPNDKYIQYLGPHIELSDNIVADLFGEIELSHNETTKTKLLDVLAILDESVKDITTISKSGLVQLYFTNKQGLKKPIHIMGDGIIKLLHIALVMLTKPGSILLLDEVENGFHYSLHPKFWEMISTLAAQEKCQIVATTHSYECISGALDGVKSANRADDFTYVRLDKADETVVPKAYNSDMLERALNTDWEVR